MLDCYSRGQGDTIPRRPAVFRREQELPLAARGGTEEKATEKAAVARDKPVPELDEPHQRRDGPDSREARVADEAQDTQAGPPGRQ